MLRPGGRALPPHDDGAEGGVGVAGRELARLEPTVEAFRTLTATRAELDGVRELRDGGHGDEDLKAMAREEIARLEGDEARLLDELRVLLLPRDPNDERDVILEIRAGAGGEEAALFAADLFRMYSRYAERQRWKVEVVSASESPAAASMVRATPRSPPSSAPGRSSSIACPSTCSGSGTSSTASSIRGSGPPSVTARSGKHFSASDGSARHRPPPFAPGPVGAAGSDPDRRRRVDDEQAHGRGASRADERGDCRCCLCDGQYRERPGHPVVLAVDARGDDVEHRCPEARDRTDSEHRGEA